jgi:hypothetical protein
MVMVVWGLALPYRQHRDNTQRDAVLQQKIWIE